MYLVVDAKEIRVLVVGIRVAAVLVVVVLIGAEEATAVWNLMTVKMDKHVKSITLSRIQELKALTSRAVVVPQVVAALIQVETVEE